MLYPEPLTVRRPRTSAAASIRALPAVLAIATVALACAPPAQADARTYIFEGGDLHFAYKPHNWAAGGVGASARMQKLTWVRWNGRRAVANGTAANNNCNPSCAEGTIIYEPGRMVWSRPRTCKASNGKHYRSFTLLRYTAGGRTTTFRFGSMLKYNCRRYPRRY